MKITIDVEFEIGSFIYLKTDPDQVKFMITAYKVEEDCILYEITAGLTRAHVSSIELSDSKSVEYM